MKKGMKAVASLCLLLHCVNSYAQDCTIRHYGVNDGLSESSVWHFLEDKNGLMWIGTGDGINLFDGYQFTVFKNNPEQKNSLSNNTIRSINQDKYGRIWVGTEKGANIYDSIQHNFTPSPISTAFPNQPIRIFSIIDDKVYFYVPVKGIYAYSQTDRSIKCIDTKYRILERINESVVINNCFWFIYKYNLCGMSLKDGSTRQFDIGLKKNYFNTYFRYDDNHILVASESGPILFNTNTYQVENLNDYPALLPFKNKVLCGFSKDWHSRFFIAILGDCLYINDKDGNLIKYYHDDNPLVNSSVSFKDIRTIYVDREENIWVGTDDVGFFKISLSNEKFKLTNVGTGLTDHIGSNFIKCFYKHDKDLWIGTYKAGINIINTTTGRIHYYTNQANNEHSLCSNTISSIYRDKEGNIWVLSEEGLCLFNSAKNNFDRIDLKKRKSKDNYTPLIFEKRNGEKWVRLENGFSRLIYANNQWHLKLVFDTIYPRVMWENENGDCLLSTNLGVLLWKDNKFKQLSEVAHWPINLSGIVANSFFKDINKSIWIGTRNGLLKLDSNYGFVKLFTTSNGMPDNFIYGILNDKHNRLWMSTNKGVTCFNPATNFFRNYTVADGLQSNEFNTGAAYLADDGEMFFGGVNGFNSFFPDEIKDNPHAPIVRLATIKLFDNDLPETKRINNSTFTYSQNTFSFEVIGIDLERPEDNTYAFKLEGVDKTWFYSGKKRDVRYSGLAPGNYVLWVKAANADGVWSDAVALYRFSILPPIWKTWWFISLILILIIGLVILVTRFISQQKLKKLLAKTEREREIEKIRSRISSDIHDDIGAGLSRIAMISDKAKSDVYQAQNVDVQLDKLSKSSRELMTSLSEIVWAMNPKNDELASLLSYLRSYAYDYFDDSGIESVVNFQDNLPAISFDPEMRRNIFLIVKEAFNNTLKYAKAKHIYLNFEVKSNMAIFEIIDDGIGIDPEKMRKFSNGLSGMRKRCEDIGGIFELNSECGKGTKIRLLIDFNLVEE